jgi:hypothetical protein
LVSVLESTPRRYPLYWDSRSSKKPDARRLLEQHGGHVVITPSADELFKDLLASVEALQKLAEPPLTTAMAIARLKRVLPDPLRRIELQDLIHGKTDQLLTALAQIPENAPDLAELDEQFDSLFEITRPLLALLIHGVRHDDGTHTRLWIETLERVMDAHHSSQHYPAVLALRAMSIEALRTEREEFFVDLLTKSRWRNPLNRFKATPAAHALHINRVINSVVNKLPRWNGGGWVFPQSHLLKEVLRDLFIEYGVTRDRYEMLCDDVEYRTGLLQQLLPRETGDLRPNSGEFISKWEYVGNNFEVPAAELRFEEDFWHRGADTAWRAVLGEQVLVAVLAEYREYLNGLQRW